MGCDIHLYVERREAGDWVLIKDDWYDDRNYELFALLADVRNKGLIEPISQPRGLPDDCSPEVQIESQEWGVDGHSHSWLGADELIAYDWSGPITNSGVIYDEYPDGTTGRATDIARHSTEWGQFPWRWRGEPVERSGAVYGRNANKYKYVEWTEKTWSAVGPAWMATLLGMARLAEGQHLRTVRTVFWFDN